MGEQHYAPMRPYLWGVMLLGGLFILAGLLIDGPAFSPAVDYSAFGFALGASFIMALDAAAAAWGRTRPAWKSRNGLPCEHGDDPVACRFCKDGAP